jgi:hypothetical protein
MIRYHTGLLMLDRLNNPVVDERARKAWDAYERGECVLLQRRVSPGFCEYFAIPIPVSQ